MSEVAATILAQLGGRRFIAMTGSKDFYGSPKALSFKVGKNPKRVTHFRVTLDADDTYTTEALRWNGRKLEHETLNKAKGVYCDMLEDVFTDCTGPYTRI